QQHFLTDQHSFPTRRSSDLPAPAVILMAGLQGAGKTTTVAKLAKHLKGKRRKKVMVVSADVYRPAAIEQLRTLAQQVDVMFFPRSEEHTSELQSREKLVCRL